MPRFGVDEAGKGPVFGSMFAAAVCVDDPTVLPDGIADSKRLTPARREELATIVRADDSIRVGVAEITPERIDDPETDMNGLTVTAHAEAIDDIGRSRGSDERFESGVAASETLDFGGSVSETTESMCTERQSLEGLCDACDTDADRFARRVADSCTVDVTVDARHGADDDDPLVGAASIVAKVERDAHVEEIAATYGDVGSGYPSDPVTRRFLETYVDEHGDVPPFARRSWSTCADVLAAAQQTGFDEF